MNKNNKSAISIRLLKFTDEIVARKYDLAVFENRANILALTGVDCDNARFMIIPSKSLAKTKYIFLTDFRYITAVKRIAPWLTVGDIKALDGTRPYSRKKYKAIGYEESVSHQIYLKYEKAFPGAKFRNVIPLINELRAVKSDKEIEKIAASAKLNDKIWQTAQKKFKAGMTEKEMARIIKKMMIDKGEGEAFDTIVCVGKNAAECHHVPDDTVWDGKEAVLVDMGVKLNGMCSDLTRNILPKRPSSLYKKAYAAVKGANALALKAARPGMKVANLDKIARDYLAARGFGEAFGHSLGHGVGIEIHEAVAVSKRSKMILAPGMVITIEPGVYLPDKLGVRIEDLVVITDTGCKSLSASSK